MPTRISALPLPISPEYAVGTGGKLIGLPNIGHPESVVDRHVGARNKGPINHTLTGEVICEERVLIAEDMTCQPARRLRAGHRNDDLSASLRRIGKPAYTRDSRASIYRVRGSARPALKIYLRAVRALPLTCGSTSYIPDRPNTSLCCACFVPTLQPA